MSVESAGDGGIAFPLRVACVDVGSNAIRFVIAEFINQIAYSTLTTEGRAIHLGHGVYLSGRLDPAVMDAAIEALASFGRQVADAGVTHYTAVATSAVRESDNGTATS